MLLNFHLIYIFIRLFCTIHVCGAAVRLLIKSWQTIMRDGKRSTSFPEKSSSSKVTSYQRRTIGDGAIDGF